MAEKDTVFSGKIKQKAIFHFKDFYGFTYDWLVGEGYKVTEKVYSEEISGDAKKIEIEWEAKKKVSDYFRFVIQVRWMILGLKNVEVQREGKKLKMNSGQVELKVKGVLVKDYEHKWEDYPVWKFLRGMYDRYIIRSRIEQYEDKLKEEVEEFIAQSKSFLVIEGMR
ncbi:MAG: hypothetical protein PHH54_02045 [Candidatus Nanoarchaeia archaeon]|nr:hypothetical protein [Candidatus Nanoarchaeia archaeon]MDD5740744.1 hypothetical protein [Candidatus Nanoarchaeia archaeon]